MDNWAVIIVLVIVILVLLGMGPDRMSDILTAKQKAWAQERARQRCANVLYADQEIERGPQEAGIVRDLELALLMGRLAQAEQCWYSRTELAQEIEERKKRNV